MITIRDVANKAEVSIATVSRVINSNRPVHPDIRDRVLKAVEELDYRPNVFARGLRQHTTAVLTENIPVVLANTEIPMLTVDQVMVDDYQGGYLAGDYLLRLNHRRIGCINLSSSYEATRFVGFRQALREAGIELTAEDLAFGNGRYDSGYKAMQELYQRRPDLTAVFVFNDLMALGAMNALRTLGKHVPEDLSIIGYDDIFYTSAFEPTLTTIAQPITRIGQECIARLLERIQEPEKPPTHITLPTALVERRSCQPLAKRDE
jgi:DNA-binding LacI/PurR family transcriptional regulator